MYLCSPCPLSWSVYKVNFTFTVPIKSTDESPLPLAGMQPTFARVVQLRFSRIICNNADIYKLGKKYDV
jgi:hypothetical protein